MTQGITVNEMRALEINCEYFGLSLDLLMENAGRGVVNEIAKDLTLKGKTCIIYCGTGGNGGDGFVTARHLVSQGVFCTVVLLGSPSQIRHPSAKRNFQIIQQMRASIVLEICRDSNHLTEIPSEADFIVDAMLGTGITGNIREPIRSAVEKMNFSAGRKYAVDTPTGVNPDTGLANESSVKADVTVTFYKPKVGLLVESTKPYVGELRVVGIGMPIEVERIAGPGDVYYVARHRDPLSHKGENGKVLVIGGSERFHGAPAFVGLGALRAGADLVKIFAPKTVIDRIGAQSPDLIVHSYNGKALSESNVTDILKIIDNIDTVVIGPGLGERRQTLVAVRQIIDRLKVTEVNCVIDGDAFKAIKAYNKPLGKNFVLTPHSHELGILTDKDVPGPLEIRERGEAVLNAAKFLQCTVTLKGPIDVVSDGFRL
ncbi:MAG: NAD(P)H-hydrate epimerase, partial [Candidatus Ranarchaeia archaeon]